jgi:predicted F0F1-ATPase subunit
MIPPTDERRRDDQGERGPGDPMRDSVARFEDRRRRWRSERGRTLAMIATVTGVGWLVVIPAVAGFAFGHWLDARAGTGIALSAGLGLLGLTLGCAAAWRRISAH